MATEFVRQFDEIEFPDGMEPQVFMDSEGREIPNPNPIVINLPGGPVTEYDRVRELIARELSMQAALSGEESFEDANDFEVEGDIFPVSPHEYSEDTELADREALAAEQERAAKAKKPKKPRQAEPDEAPGVEGVADPLDQPPEDAQS